METQAAGSRAVRRLKGAFFILGALSLMIQSLMIRECFAQLQGNEMFLGIFYCGWFGGIMSGAALGSRAARSERSFRRQWLFLAQAPALVALVRAFRLFLDAPSAAPSFSSSVALLFAVSAPVGVVIGRLFPLGCAALADAGQRDNAAGAAYVWESSGAVAGGFFFSFIAVEAFGGFELACLTAVLAAFVFAFVLPSSERPWLARSLALTAAAAATILASPGEHWLSQLKLRALAPGRTLVAALDTAYSHLDLTEQGGEYVLFHDGQPGAPFPDPYNDVPAAAGLLAQHPDPRRILLLGWTEPGVIQSLLDFGADEITMVTPDARLVRAGLQWLPPELSAVYQHPRVRAVIADPRKFIQRSAAQYDVIALRVGEPVNGQLNRMFTVEFFTEARRRLAVPGVLCLDFHCSIHAVGRELSDYGGTLYQTLRAVFPDVIARPGDTCQLVAGTLPGVVSADPETLARRAEQWPDLGGAFSPFLFYMEFPPDQTARINELLLNSAALVNRDERPAAYLYHLLLWSRWQAAGERSALRQSLRTLVDGGWRPWLFVWFAALTLWAAWQFLRRRRGRAAAGLGLLTIGAAGFASMGGQLALLFSYQAAHGYLYQMIAWINALFMAGLALGSWAAGYWLRRTARADAGLFIVTSIFVLFLALLPRAAEVARAAQALEFLLFVVAGCLTGFIFPLGTELVRRDSTTGRAAAWADLTDHLGAALAAPLTALMLLPAMGIAPAARLLAVGLAALLPLWAVAARQHRPE